MKSIFGDFNKKYARFMQGRYGSDKLNAVLLVIAFVLMVLSHIPFMGILSIVAWILLIWIFYRTYSKKIYKRREELFVYMRYERTVKACLTVFKNNIKYRKTHKYFRCKKCSTVCRVPRHKGKIEVTCPNCKDKTIRYS